MGISSWSGKPWRVLKGCGMVPVRAAPGAGGALAQGSAMAGVEVLVLGGGRSAKGEKRHQTRGREWGL